MDQDPKRIFKYRRVRVGYRRNATEQYCGNGNGVRPAFTLPGTFPVIQNPDGTYSPAA